MQSKMIHLTKDSLPIYMQFPKFLLGTDLSYTAMIIYMILLDRARLSLENDRKNEKGVTYLVYPIEELAKAVHRGQTTVKDSIAELRRAGLIETDRSSSSRANRIYVLVPADTGKGGKQKKIRRTISDQPDSQISGCRSDRNPDIKQPDICPSDSRNTNCQTSGILSANNTYSNNTYSNNDFSNNDIDHSDISNYENTSSSDARSVSGKRKYGCFNNVVLSDDDVAKLKASVNNYAAYIDRFSCYMRDTSKTYHDHAAQIVSWAIKDGAYQRPGESKYDEEDYIL